MIMNLLSAKRNAVLKAGNVLPKKAMIMVDRQNGRKRGGEQQNICQAKGSTTSR